MSLDRMRNGVTPDAARAAVETLLLWAGENPDREGLRDTPTRVLKAYAEWFSGYGANIPALFKVFEDGAAGCDEMVLVRGIPVVSHCEHHMAMITGVAHVAYIPDGKILGLSKFNRVVDAFARRLQVQERLTGQIADAFAEFLQPRGVGVVIHANHACMSSRGVKHNGSITTTSALRGAMLTDAAARAEFLALARDTSGGAL